MNCEVLQKCLDTISDQNIREFTRRTLDKLPEYFFKVAASSTGKYHPAFAAGEGGLVRHTAMAVRVANELFTLEMFSHLIKDRDLILSALILHDGLKYGTAQSQYSVHEHPVLMRDFVIQNAEGYDFAFTIAELISSHMGQWSVNKYSSIALPKPETDQQNFVHLCDYIASRKFIDG